MKDSHSRMREFLFLLLLGTFLIVARGDDITHRYKEGDKVNFYVHKVGPYANPQEAYEYYVLPYCAPHDEDKSAGVDKNGGGGGLFNKHKSNSIGEYLGGHALRHSGHTITFALENKEIEECTTSALTEAEANKFATAAKDQWFYQMYLDDLPVWGMVGELVQKEGGSNEIHELQPHVYTTRTVTIHYNGDRIVKVDLSSNPSDLVLVQPGVRLTFTTEIIWKPTNEAFHSRFDRYLDHSFFKHQIHWFSLLNSFMMVLFLMGLVALILLRTLRKDYARYAVSTIDEEVMGGETGDFTDENGKPLIEEGGGGSSTTRSTEESGWKQVHGDVFRKPSLLPVFAAILGSGWQLIVLTLGVMLFAVAGPLHGELHEDRGEVQHAIIWCYALSSVISGYSSGSYFKMYYATSTTGREKASTSGSSGTEWQLAMFLTVLLLPIVTVSIMSFLNFIALVYGTINYIPFLVIVKIFLIWTFTSVPLCIMGTLAGRHSKYGGMVVGKKPGSRSDFPCRVNAIPRPIPENVPWYGKPMNIIPFAGLLSFGSIFIELYYILTSLWNYKFYHVYGFLLGVYAMLAIVVSMTTVIVVYFCLNHENYHWQWTAFASGASTSVYVFLYAFYFYVFKTDMSGFLQSMHYFGYMALLSLNLGTLCGTIGHFSASKFVKAIFENVKLD
mmetsp:Transcript_7944/g.11332  ORF Transcript_7944/g.11332 Transcript_7944/m.11332 type:complete len:671 (+) Transcript_7944:67-2079(+)